MKSTHTLLQHYQKEIQNKKIVQAYHMLLRFLMQAKADFAFHHKAEFNVGNISLGYLDYSYFPFFDRELREKKLRYGIVLNHATLQIELWLMGQNAKVQQDYWKTLKKSKWNAHRTTMPQYAILEVVLLDELNFDQTEEMLLAIRTKALQTIAEINPLL
ncbi:hypothetical protein [Myroides odoratus]|uniref:DUF7000 family protein n=1 Tax=Myroides odoratus TaxID=256 RepID=UPI00333FD3AA